MFSKRDKPDTPNDPITSNSTVGNVVPIPTLPSNWDLPTKVETPVTYKSVVEVTPVTFTSPTTCNLCCGFVVPRPILLLTP